MKIAAGVAASLAAIWLLGVGVVATTTALSGTVTSPGANAIRGAALCIGLLGMSCAGYIAWPSRWNIPAHTQLAFALIAYVLPIAGLGRLEQMSPAVLNLYASLALAGFALTVVGVICGRIFANAVSRSRHRSGFAKTRRFLASWPIDQVGEAAALRRLRIVAGGSLLALLGCFAVMGFVPALAADPFQAKFFRGIYAAAYAPVAPIYRTATTAIALLLPVIMMVAIKRRMIRDWVVLIGCVGVMLLSLQRAPAVTGIVMCLGVLLAIRRISMVVYIAILVGVNALGSAVYFVLGALGLSSYSFVSAGGGSLAQQVAAGAPDVADQATFLRAWLANPEYTFGKTFFGGLVPGNFEWNPSVWSLSVVNPGQNVSAIVSGGLRLPAPIWGYVSFDWAGVIAVCLLSGFFVGLIAAVASQVIPLQTPIGTAWALVVYLCLEDLLVYFYRLSYLSVLQLVVLVLIVGGVSKLRIERTRERQRGFENWGLHGG
ncbi:hypothetical protein HP550_06860 [Cellulomonas humilata]|uniref:Oligosaccharide repeat unit polymerase n=1 Tax=Cellulomonas humilata TaxID=144055 RepID=A0A7Y6A0L8_9CELL|nr:hypothetical protein [Cellulomonas humilata]NUU16968.1 hypothetical protein [Cellulomonas humilata]